MCITVQKYRNAVVMYYICSFCGIVLFFFPVVSVWICSTLGRGRGCCSVFHHMCGFHFYPQDVVSSRATGRHVHTASSKSFVLQEEDSLGEGSKPVSKPWYLPEHPENLQNGQNCRLVDFISKRLAALLGFDPFSVSQV